MKQVMTQALAMAILLASSANAQDTTATDEESAIRAVGEAYVEAYNRRDAAAVASYWSPEAVYVNRVTGQSVIGQQAISKQFEEAFASNDDQSLAVEIESIRLISPNVAVEQGAATFSSNGSESDRMEYSAIYVRRDGKWLLDRVTDDEPMIEPSNQQHLQPLEWLIGTWVDADDQFEIRTVCSWTTNQNFITRTFSVTPDQRVELSGIQIIGWDAADKRIRSWTFDSAGGFAQGRWTKIGSQWHVHKQGVTAAGETTTAVNRLTVIDQDSFSLQSTQRTIGGELLPNIDEVIVVRN